MTGRQVERPFVVCDGGQGANWSWLNETFGPPKPRPSVAPELRTDLEKAIQASLDWAGQVLVSVVRLAQFMPALAAGGLRGNAAERMISAANLMSCSADDLNDICERLRSAAAEVAGEIESPNYLGVN